MNSLIEQKISGIILLILFLYNLWRITIPFKAKGHFSIQFYWSRLVFRFLLLFYLFFFLIFIKKFILYLNFYFNNNYI